MAESSAPVKPQSPRWKFERAVRESTLKPADRLVLFVLAQEANGSLNLGKHSPSMGQIAERTGLADSTVRECCKRLAEAGWLSNTRKRGQWPRWTLRTVSTSPVVGDVRDETERSTSPVVGDDIAGGRRSTSPVAGGSTHQTMPEAKPDQNPPEGEAPPLSKAAEQIQAEVPASSPPQGGSSKTAPDPQPAAEAAPAAAAAVPPAVDADDRNRRTAIADKLTENYWSKYGKRGAQSFITVRSILRRILANDVDPYEIAAALDRLGSQSRPVSPGWIQGELGRMRAERRPASLTEAERAGAHDDEKYSIGFDGKKVLTVS
jgi:hypothetical protein